MKKLICLLFGCVVMSMNIFATTFGKPKGVLCPECLMLLKEFPLMSGNTFGSTFWSDTKLEAPMLPVIPAIVKCPGCGEVFIVKDNYAKSDFTESDMNRATNTRECKPKFEDHAKVFPLIENRKQAYIWVWQAFNDYYRTDRLDEAAANREIFTKYANEFIEMLDESDDNDFLIKAELLRETERYEECITLLETRTLDGFKASVAKQMLERAKSGDMRVFKVEQKK